MKVSFHLNGEPTEVDAESDKPLLWVLREDLDLTGTKFGCGRALCGACTLHVDGQATRACAFPIKFAEGRSVTTIENLESDPLGKAVVDAWIKKDVVQCGWCQPGQCMSAAALLKEVPDPERYGVPELIDGRIARVIEKPTDPPSNYSVVGIYFYDASVFEYIKGLSPSERGELEISDVSNRYAQAGALSHGILDGWWGDAGTFDGLEEANQLARDLIYEEIGHEYAR